MMGLMALKTRADFDAAIEQAEEMLRYMAAQELRAVRNRRRLPYDVRPFMQLRRAARALAAHRDELQYWRAVLFPLPFFVTQEEAEQLFANGIIKLG